MSMCGVSALYLPIYLSISIEPVFSSVGTRRWALSEQAPFAPKSDDRHPPGQCPVERRASLECACELRPRHLSQRVMKFRMQEIYNVAVIIGFSTPVPA